MGRGSSAPGDPDKLAAGFDVGGFLVDVELVDVIGVDGSLGRVAGAGFGSAGAVVEDSAT